MDAFPSTIILLGNSGVGKSASGNTILRRQAFPSKASFYPVTKEIRQETGRVLGTQVRVIDTPGILESEQQLKNFCQNLLQSSGPHLFLVVIRVDRFSEEDQEAVEAAVRVIGDQNLRKTYLLFTYGDALKHRLLKDVICENGSLKKVVEMFEGRYHLFNNQHGGQEHAEHLMWKFLQPAVPADPIHQGAKSIALIGLPGGGKSSSGNTILGFARFKSGCDFDSFSTEIALESAEVEGCQLTVVDAPGFTDKALTPEELYLKITKMIKKASPGPHAFVLVIRIGQISEADKKLFELLPKLLGDDASNYTMVLFTHGDELKGQSADNLIQSSRCVSDLVSTCRGRFCVFDNTQRENRLQVREFLSKIDEMVEANGGKRYTTDMIKPPRNYKKTILKVLTPFLFAVLIGGFVVMKVGLKAGVVSGVLSGLVVLGFIFFW